MQFTELQDKLKAMTRKQANAIADKADIPQSTVAKIRKGHTKQPRINTVEALSQAMTNRKAKISHQLQSFKADRLPSVDKPTANAFAWMGKSQAMAGVRSKSAKQIKQDAVRENPESSLGYATHETNSFKAPR